MSKRANLSAAVFFLITTFGCGSDEIPQKYAALGIPPSPEKVKSTEKVDVAWHLTYHSPAKPEDVTKMIDTLTAAGYQVEYPRRKDMLAKSKDETLCFAWNELETSLLFRVNDCM